MLCPIWRKRSYFGSRARQYPYGRLIYVRVRERPLAGAPIRSDSCKVALGNRAERLGSLDSGQQCDGFDTRQMADRIRAELIESDCLMREDGVTQVGEGPGGRVRRRIAERARGRRGARRALPARGAHQRRQRRPPGLARRRRRAPPSGRGRAALPGRRLRRGDAPAAVTASRVVHPNLVGVYDAIDEGERAYVVREWVDGTALRELVAEEGPLDAERATSVAHAVADAVAAVHATGMVHGNVHPGTVLVADDGRVVLADARVDRRHHQHRGRRPRPSARVALLRAHRPLAARRGRRRPRCPTPSATAPAPSPRPARCGPASRRTSTTWPWTCSTRSWRCPRRRCSPPSWPAWTPATTAAFGGNGTAALRRRDRPGGARAPRGHPAAAGRRRCRARAGRLRPGARPSARSTPTRPSRPRARPSRQRRGRGQRQPPRRQPKAIDLTADQVRIVDPRSATATNCDARRRTWSTATRRRSGRPTGYTAAELRQHGQERHGHPDHLDKPQVVSSVQVQLSAPGASAR